MCQCTIKRHCVRHYISEFLLTVSAPWPTGGGRGEEEEEECCSSSAAAQASSQVSLWVYLYIIGLFALYRSLYRQRLANRSAATLHRSLYGSIYTLQVSLLFTVSAWPTGVLLAGHTGVADVLPRCKKNNLPTKNNLPHQCCYSLATLVLLMCCRAACACRRLLRKRARVTRMWDADALPVVSQISRRSVQSVVCI